MNEDIKQEKRPYQKPQIEQVELVVEEQVLGGCKNLDESGPLGVDNCIDDACNLTGT